METSRDIIHAQLVGIVWGTSNRRASPWAAAPDGWCCQAPAANGARRSRIAITLALLPVRIDVDQLDPNRVGNVALFQFLPKATA